MFHVIYQAKWHISMVHLLIIKFNFSKMVFCSIDLYSYSSHPKNTWRANQKWQHQIHTHKCFTMFHLENPHFGMGTSKRVVLTRVFSDGFLPPRGTCRNNLFGHQNSLRTCYRCALGQFGGIPCGVQIGWGIKQRELSIIAYYTGKMVIMIMLNSSNSLVHYKNFLGWSG